MNNSDRQSSPTVNPTLRLSRPWPKHRTGGAWIYTLLIMLQLGLLTSCSSAPEPASAPLPESNQAAETGMAASDTPVPQATPQLIKTAEIKVEVKSIDTTIPRVSAIVKAQQGDILGLNDTKPVDDRPYTVFIQLRVPQSRLETTLAELAKLGVVQSQALQAEDVANQLVDLAARLRNLKRSETVLLGLMERSGSVADVLKVSQELSAVRQSIEQIDAQLTNLKNQVAFSTVRVTLQAEARSLPPEPNLLTQVGETWASSTRSLRDVSVGLLKLLIWLLVYSPYWGAIAAIILYVQHRRKKSRATLPPSSTPDSPPTDVTS
uniref:DUF4349 domain-containing protein n=1 Tax=Cyanothece sp. (strain PCC 7425 / ATCC 29141) TaxID=395961 RepID=B8HNN0_CYAP4